MRRLRLVLFPLAALALSSLAARSDDFVNDYPTSARAEYVFACMNTNGDSQPALQKCSCSIDTIASLLPYQAYVEGETVASLNQAQGQIGGMFRGSTIARDALAQLRRAQAEAEILCF